jgi:hypothetical protein
MLKVWFWPSHLRTSEYKKYYFQQDGAPPHTSNIVQEWLARVDDLKVNIEREIRNIKPDGLKTTF